MPIAKKIKELFQNIASGITGVFRPKEVINTDDAETVMEKYVPEFETEVRKVTQGLIDGKVSPRDWGDTILEELTDLYLTAAAAAAGHVGRLTPEIKRDVEKQIQEQKRYLNQFVSDLRDADTGLELDKILNRVMMYTGGGYEIAERARNRNAGRPELPFYPKKRTRCLSNCYCKWKWTKLRGDGNWNVVWVIDKRQENCETCLKRAKVCNPLKIRNYEIKTNVSGRDLYYDY